MKEETFEPKTKIFCNSCDQMKKENSTMRKALSDTNKNYIEIVNENLELKKTVEQLRTKLENWNRV